MLEHCRIIHDVGHKCGTFERGKDLHRDGELETASDKPIDSQNEESVDLSPGLLGKIL